MIRALAWLNPSFARDLLNLQPESSASPIACGDADRLRHIGQELAKCGTSIGANAEEAQDGQTRPDFIAKLAVSRKESRETICWLRLALRVEVVTSDDVKWEMEEAAQLRAMIVSAIKTAQSSQSRG